MENIRDDTTLWLLDPSFCGVVIALCFNLIKGGRIKYRRSLCSKSLLVFIDLCNHWFGAAFEPICWPQVYQDEKGESLEYRYAEVVRNCVDTWCKNEAVCIETDVSDALRHYISAELRKIAVPVLAVAENVADSNQKNLYLVRWSLVSSLFKRQCIDYGKDMCFVPSIDITLFYPLGVVVQMVIAWLNIKKHPCPPSDSRDAVLIEYSPLDYPAFLGFWLSNFQAKDVRVVFFSTPACRPSSKDLDAMNSLNWEHMPFTRFALAGQDVRETFHVVCKHIFRRPILLHHFVVLFHGYCVFYKTFFLLFKARLLLQYQDHSWAQGALRKAMESAGGIMAGLHWSNIPTADRSNFFSPQDIFFLWGHSHRYLLSLGGVKERLSLYSGAWLTEVAESITECSSRLFVIVVFDSSTDELIHQTPQALRVFYGVIVDFLECNTGAMALFKPKNNAHNCIDVLQESDRVLSARFSTLESAGRVRWLPASTSPCDAARNSHLCVCFGINSAGVLSSLLGARSIHWDCAGFRRYFMYQHIGQRVVFHDLAEFKDALVRAMAGDDKVGDFSPFVGQLDSFHDSQGPYRIGWFFTQYFGYLQNKGDAREALCAAVADYTRIWPKALPEDK